MATSEPKRLNAAPVLSSPPSNGKAITNDMLHASRDMYQKAMARADDTGAAVANLAALCEWDLVDFSAALCEAENRMALALDPTMASTLACLRAEVAELDELTAKARAQQ